MAKPKKVSHFVFIPILLAGLYSTRIYISEKNKKTLDDLEQVLEGLVQGGDHA